MSHADEPTLLEQPRRRDALRRSWLLSADTRHHRRRRRLAGELEQLVRRAGAEEGQPVRQCASQLLLIAAVLRSPLPLPLDGVAAVNALLRDRHGALCADGDLADLLDDLRDVEQALGMRGSHRRAAQAIAAGEVSVLRSTDGA
jgi:hypothetical protein